VKYLTGEHESSAPESIVVRQAVFSDVAAIVELERTAPTAAHWRPDDYARIFDRGAVPRVALVLEAETRVVGFLVAVNLGSDWEIENVVVAEDARGRGLGSRLVEAFVDRVRRRGETTVFLEVRESNRSARSLYEKCGFTIAGRRRSYYSQPLEDAVVYRLDIRSEDSEIRTR